MEIENQTPVETKEVVGTKTEQKTEAKGMRSHFESNIAEMKQKHAEEVASLKEKVQSFEARQSTVEARHINNLFEKNGVEFDEQKEEIERIAKTSGLTYDELLKDDFVKERIKSIGGRLKAQKATEQGSGTGNSFAQYDKDGTFPTDPKEKKAYWAWKNGGVENKGIYSKSKF
jgi:hypothetical protein